MGTVEVTIEKIIPGGLGLGQVEGKRVLVPFTAPGERVRVEPTEEHPQYLWAIPVEILEPHAARREPPCPYFGTCGGCDLQHLPHREQLAAKRGMVTDALRRIGRLEIDEILREPEPVCAEFGYRNRIRLSYGPGRRVGLVRRGSNRVVPIERCLLMPDAWNEDMLPWLKTLPTADKASFRLDTDGRALAAITGHPAIRGRVTKRLSALEEKEAPFPGALGVSVNARTLWGGSQMEVHLADHRFQVSAGSFFQVNYRGVARLIETAGREAGGTAGGVLIDLYAGVGTFAITLAAGFDRVIGVEIARSAVHDFKTNLALNGIANVELIEGPAARVLPRIVSELSTTSGVTVLADPPRTGLEKDAVSQMADLGPDRIVYVSCDPATLARDVARLNEKGYALRSLEIIDLFPQTAHVECVAALAKN